MNETNLGAKRALDALVNRKLAYDTLKKFFARDGEKPAGGPADKSTNPRKLVIQRRLSPIAQKALEERMLSAKRKAG